VSSGFPHGTLVINVSGSLLLGLVLGLAMHHGLTNAPTTVIGAGFAGGYTTLSTWAYETLMLAEEREFRAAAINVVVSAGSASPRRRPLRSRTGSKHQIGVDSPRMRWQINPDLGRAG